MKVTKRGLGMKKVVAGAMAALTFGAASASAGDLGDYVNRDVAEVEEKMGVIEYGVKFGTGGLAGLVSHELAHVAASGGNARYDPLNDINTVKYDEEPNALTAGAGLLFQNAVSAAIVNSNLDLKDSPTALGYLAFTGISNLSYALSSEDDKGNDVNSASKASGISGDLIRGGLLLSTAYLGWEAYKNIMGDDPNGSSKFSPYFGADGTSGVECDIRGKANFYAGFNPKMKAPMVGINIPLGGKKHQYRKK